MKKFNWKNRKLISSLATVIFIGIGLGASESEMAGRVVSEAFCAEEQCDA